MNHRLRFRWVSLCLLAALLAAPIPGQAADSDEAAQQAFRAGVDAARQERWPQALAAFESAYDLSPRPVILINLAGVQVRTGRLIEAAKNYHRILDEASTSETAAFKRAAAEVLPSLEGRIPRMRLRATGLTAADLVQIDGQPIAVTGLGAEHPLDPGEHIIVVQRVGIERARVLFTLGEGERRQISLPLPGLAADPSADPGSIAKGVALGVSAQGEGPSTPSRSPRRWWASPWPWVLAGAAIAGASVAAILVRGGDRNQTFSGNVPPGQISVH
jgi:hypothetical protein